MGSGHIVRIAKEERDWVLGCHSLRFSILRAALMDWCRPDWDQPVTEHLGTLTHERNENSPWILVENFTRRTHYEWGGVWSGDPELGLLCLGNTDPYRTCSWDQNSGGGGGWRCMFVCICVWVYVVCVCVCCVYVCVSMSVCVCVCMCAREIWEHGVADGAPFCCGVTGFPEVCYGTLQPQRAHLSSRSSKGNRGHFLKSTGPQAATTHPNISISSNKTRATVLGLSKPLGS